MIGRPLTISAKACQEIIQKLELMEHNLGVKINKSITIDWSDLEEYARIVERIRIYRQIEPYVVYREEK